MPPPELADVEKWKTLALAIPAISSLLTPLVIAVASWITVRRGERSAQVLERNEELRSRHAARKVDEVKETLRVGTAKTDLRISELMEVAKTIHTLVNSDRGILLDLNRRQARRIADLTKGTEDGEEDERLAVIADQIYEAHQKQQEVVDRRAEIDKKIANSLKGKAFDVQTLVRVSPKPPPNDLILDGGMVAICGESFDEWMRVQDSIGMHWTVISDTIEASNEGLPIRVVIVGRYVSL